VCRLVPMRLLAPYDLPGLSGPKSAIRVSSIATCVTASYDLERNKRARSGHRMYDPFFSESDSLASADSSCGAAFMPYQAEPCPRSSRMLVPLVFRFLRELAHYPAAT
jgi:hypothetical protein